MSYYMQTKILEAFLRVLNISLTTSVVIVLVLAVRLLFKKAPKVFSYALWGVVFFRLLCPVPVETAFSLLPVNASPMSLYTIHAETPQIATGIAALDQVINPLLPTPAAGASVNPLQLAAVIGEILWLAGIVLLAVYSIVTLFRLKKRLVGAVRLHDNIFVADRIGTPFVVGLLRPKIYLPSSLSAQEQSYCILHEQLHIKRLDHLAKLVAFAALCLHWFNPLVWVAFRLAVRDMEMSCDERVIKQLGGDIREQYSASLLRLATGRSMVAATPLAFGEGDTKDRIKNVLRYKKTALWGSAIALATVAVVCVAFAASPQPDSMQWAKRLRVEQIEKVELVVMNGSTNPDEQYRLLDRAEYPEIAALVKQARGGYLPNPESLAGGAVSYYITTKDGIRHEFCNLGNTYLIVDGDSYDAGYGWLASWGNQSGNAPIPADFYPDTTDNLHNLSQDGALTTTALQLSDFELYTNSEKIMVRAPDTTDDVQIELYAWGDEQLLQSLTLNQSAQDGTFTNLTAARKYRIVAVGNNNTKIVVSE